MTFVTRPPLFGVEEWDVCYFHQLHAGSLIDGLCSS